MHLQSLGMTDRVNRKTSLKHLEKMSGDIPVGAAP
jgi:hypothetical protein